MHHLKLKKIKQFTYTLAVSVLMATGCEKERDKGPAGEYEKGVFIINEGSFLNSNGEISYFNKNTKTITNKLFETVNNRPLGGDVVQSMLIFNNNAYIVCNNSNKIEIVDANTFESKNVIQNLALPRYMIAANNKGYISEWVNFSGKGRVSIVDLLTNTIIKTIEVGRLPEQMAIINNKLYVANSDEKTLTVINITTDTFDKNIHVSDSPTDFRIDANVKLWVLCSGKKVYDNNPPDFIDESQSTPGALVRINPVSENIEFTVPFNSISSPEDLQINGQRNKLYYSYAGAVYSHDINAASLSATPFIRRSFYGIGIDPVEDIFYGAQASFTADGKVIRFNTSTGAAMDSVNVTIGPNGFVFKN
jgi:YVTN family beta-propeller protein